MKLVSSVYQKCGTEIPLDAPEGSCPGRLLEAALLAAGGQVVSAISSSLKALG